MLKQSIKVIFKSKIKKTQTFQDEAPVEGSRSIKAHDNPMIIVIIINGQQIENPQICSQMTQMVKKW